MSTMQIRNVPEDVARITKARAALKGLSLSDYLLDLVTAQAQVPTIDEVRARLRERGPSAVNADAAAIIRAERDAG